MKPCRRNATYNPLGAGISKGHRQIKALKPTEIPLKSPSGEHCVIDADWEQATGDTEVGLVEAQIMLSLSRSMMSSL